MISDTIIKDTFIVQTVQKGLDAVLKIQIERIAGAGDDVRKKFPDIDTILADVRSRSLSIAANQGLSLFSMQFTKKLRFLDMKKLGNLKVYNKKVWGQLYVDTLPELKYGLTEEIKTSIHDQLTEAGNQLKQK